MKRKQKMEENAEELLKQFKKSGKKIKVVSKGGYKADTPDQGVLKTVGYKVGNEGVSKEIRKTFLIIF